jgi:hypothetical protein
MRRFFALLRMTAGVSVILNVVKDLLVNHPLSTNCIT